MRLPIDRAHALPAGILASGFGLMQYHAASYWMAETGSWSGAAWPVVIEAAGLWMCARPIDTGRGVRRLGGWARKAAIRTAGVLGIGVVLSSSMLQVGGDSLWSALDTWQTQQERAERIGALQDGIESRRASIRDLEAKSNTDNYLVATRDARQLRDEIAAKERRLEEMQEAQAQAPGLATILQGSVQSLLAVLALLVLAASNVAQAALVLPRLGGGSRDTDATLPHATGVAEAPERGTCGNRCGKAVAEDATPATAPATDATPDVAAPEGDATPAETPEPEAAEALLEAANEEAEAVDAEGAGGEDAPEAVAGVASEPVARDTVAASADPAFVARRVAQMLQAERDNGATRNDLAERYGVRPEEISRVLNPNSKRAPSSTTIQTLAEKMLGGQAAQA